jgi:peptidoglycan/LPS O-acetylase OafA/YrhL
MQRTHPGNNFDFIRFLAAGMVWYSHCYVLYGDRADWLSRYIPFESFGSLGVAIFFVISGYFVTASYDHHGKLLPFLRNRSLRILPALIVVVLFSALLLGPSMTSQGLHDYFSSRRTWTYLNSMLIFPLHYDLPGVFNANPVHAVNGSLWSLKQEVRCYGAVALLGVLGVLRPRVMLLLLFGLLSIRIYGVVKPSERLLHMRWEDLELMTRLSSQFAAGALLYLARERLKPKALWALSALALVAVGAWLGNVCGHILFDLSLAYFLICFGFFTLPVLRHFGHFGDFSYGLYLYAFPMQQLVMALSPHAAFGFFMASSFALTLFCAVLSWHMVEKRALALKR